MSTDTELKTTFLNTNTAQDDDCVQCPTCEAKLKRNEVANHCQLEVERLRDMQISGRLTLDEVPSTTTGKTNDDVSYSNEKNTERRKPWTIFQKVQRNRQIRQRQRTRKRNSSPPTTEPCCPVCNKHFPQSEIQRHANQCLKRTTRSSVNGVNKERDHNSTDDDDDSGEEYEEYEWAGQKRIRVSTLVHGGYSALGLGQAIKYNGSQHANDEEEDLNVDEDDTHIFGPAQYTETDVIPLVSEDSTPDGTSDSFMGNSNVTSYMRRLIASGDTANACTSINNHSNDATTKVAEVTENQQTLSDPCAAASSSSSCAIAKNKHEQSYQQVIESLKAKLRLYESQVQSKFKCLICMDDYKNPAISVSCWHVYCEQCWLRTLGARKLCPQCNSITTPKDLRRIYL